MKQKVAESWDFKILLHLSIYFSNILLLATIEFECDGSIPAEFQQELIRWSLWLAPWHSVGMTVMVTKETDVEMLQKNFPEEFPDISTFEWVLCSCRMEHRHTHRRWLWSGWKITFPRNWSRWSQNSLAPTFTRY